MVLETILLNCKGDLSHRFTQVRWKEYIFISEETGFGH